MDAQERALIIAGLIGIATGIGKVMIGTDPITVRLALGHAMLNCILALSAFSMLAWIPDASLPLLVGGSAGIASVGSSGLLILLQRFTGGRQ